VCDDGSHDLGNGVHVPHGFGKDATRVFYYDFNGKPNWVRKASPDTFVSHNDGYFGKGRYYLSLVSGVTFSDEQK